MIFGREGTMPRCIFAGGRIGPAVAIAMQNPGETTGLNRVRGRKMLFSRAKHCDQQFTGCEFSGSNEQN